MKLKRADTRIPAGRVTGYDLAQHLDGVAGLLPGISDALPFSVAPGLGDGCHHCPGTDASWAGVCCRDFFRPVYSLYSVLVEAAPQRAS